MKRGKFITFEGLDGAGKSTHIRSVVDLIAGRGHVVLSTREPGGTPLAEKLRTLLLSERMDVDTEMLLMFAARQNHLFELIRPALTRGDWVVSDRFTDASYAYQGGGRGVANERIAALEAWVHNDLQPDLTLLFDLPYDLARQRIEQFRALDRFELEKADFHEKVRQAYLRRAAATGGRVVIIDATMDLQGVAEQVKIAMEALWA